MNDRKFSVRAEQVLRCAQAAAGELGHGYVGCEHLLLAMLREEGDAACRINPVWAVSANYSYLHMAYPVVAAPEHKLYAGVDFSRRRWKASTGVQYVHGLYTSVKPVASLSARPGGSICSCGERTCWRSVMRSTTGFPCRKQRRWAV